MMNCQGNYVAELGFKLVTSGSAVRCTTNCIMEHSEGQSSDMLKFFAEKMRVAFALQKLLSFFQQKISEYCILNPLKQLTT